MTSNIYSLTLGCIIFLIVSANIQIESISQLASLANADISATYGEFEASLSAAVVDPVLLKYADSVLDFAFVTDELKYQLPGEDNNCYIQGLKDSEGIAVHGVSQSANIDESLFSEYTSDDQIGEIECNHRNDRRGSVW